MIKVDFVNSKNRLKDFEGEYFDRINKKVGKQWTPLNKLKRDAKKFKRKRKDILEYCIANYYELIVGKPDRLQKFVEYFRRKGWTSYLKGNKEFRDKILTSFGYETNFRTKEDRGIWFSNLLNIKACPYCNSQFTLISRESGNPIRKLFQFDHFFPASSAPYLSISMYNLIPSCAYCNLIKSEGNLTIQNSYHPYYNSIHNKSKFLIDNKTVLTKIIKDIALSSIKINFVHRSNAHRSLVKKHSKLFDITGIYENHSDFAEELLIKAILYPKSKKKELLKIKGLFVDEATYLRYLLGNYPLQEDILRRPLAKFTQDIARQLKLIK